MYYMACRRETLTGDLLLDNIEKKKDCCTWILTVTVDSSGRSNSVE